MFKFTNANTVSNRGFILKKLVLLTLVLATILVSCTDEEIKSVENMPFDKIYHDRKTVLQQDLSIQYIKSYEYEFSGSMINILEKKLKESIENIVGKLSMNEALGQDDVYTLLEVLGIVENMQSLIEKLEDSKGTLLLPKNSRHFKYDALNYDNKKITPKNIADAYIWKNVIKYENKKNKTELNLVLKVGNYYFKLGYNINEIKGTVSLYLAQ